MNIIAQPTRYRVEERTLDADGNTLHTRGILTAPDLNHGLKLFRELLAIDPDKYKSGNGYRLVLVEDGDR